MENKKVLFLINNLSRGGAEGVFYSEAKALMDLGYQAEIYTLYPNNFRNIYDLKGCLRLAKKIKKEKITHVYSTLDDANFVAKIVRIFASFKLFCREANMTEDKSLKFKIADVLLNFFVYKLVMVAKAVKDSYTSYDPFHKNKMIVLYNGVDIPDLKIKETHNPVKILAVGSFTLKKGFEDLIEIFKDYIFPRYQNFELNIIGDGILLNKISSKVKQYGMEDKIKCLGAMDKISVRTHYLNSNVFVLTSKKEGCPNALLEAMSYGLAPICFSVGAVPEIIENGISGIGVTPNDKKVFGEELGNLLESSEKIIKIGQEARRRVTNNFSFDVHLKNLLNVLELKI